MTNETHSADVKLRFVTKAWAWDDYEGWYITLTSPQLQVWDGTEWRHVPIVRDHDIGPRPQIPGRWQK